MDYGAKRAIARKYSHLPSLLPFGTLFQKPSAARDFPEFRSEIFATFCAPRKQPRENGVAEQGHKFEARETVFLPLHACRHGLAPINGDPERRLSERNPEKLNPATRDRNIDHPDRNTISARLAHGRAKGQSDPLQWFAHLQAQLPLMAGRLLVSCTLWLRKACDLEIPGARARFDTQINHGECKYRTGIM
jgi:hypothetical protein